MRAHASKRILAAPSAAAAIAGASLAAAAPAAPAWMPASASPFEKEAYRYYNAVCPKSRLFALPHHRAHGWIHRLVTCHRYACASGPAHVPRPSRSPATRASTRSFCNARPRHCNRADRPRISRRRASSPGPFGTHDLRHPPPLFEVMTNRLYYARFLYPLPCWGTARNRKAKQTSEGEGRQRDSQMCSQQDEGQKDMRFAAHLARRASSSLLHRFPLVGVFPILHSDWVAAVANCVIAVGSRATRSRVRLHEHAGWSLVPPCLSPLLAPACVPAPASVRRPADAIRISSPADRDEGARGPPTRREPLRSHYLPRGTAPHALAGSNKRASCELLNARSFPRSRTSILVFPPSVSPPRTSLRPPCGTADRPQRRSRNALQFRRPQHAGFPRGRTPAALRRPSAGVSWGKCRGRE